MGCAFDSNKVKIAAENNRDGCGIARVADGRIHVRKGMWTPEEFAKIHAEEQEKGGGPIVWHARIGTDGVKTEKNCHPFDLQNIDDGDPYDAVLFHNGRIADAPTWDKDGSDTNNFCAMLRPLLKADPNLLHSDALHHIIQSFIGKTYNKVVILTSFNGGEIIFFNRQLGVMIDSTVADTKKEGYNYDEHIWASNEHSFTEKKPYVANPSVLGSSGGGYMSSDDWEATYYKSYPERKATSTVTGSHGKAWGNVREFYFKFNVETKMLEKYRRIYKPGTMMEHQLQYQLKPTPDLLEKLTKRVLHANQKYVWLEDDDPLWPTGASTMLPHEKSMRELKRERKAQLKQVKRPLTTDDLVRMTVAEIRAIITHAPDRMAKWLLSHELNSSQGVTEQEVLTLLKDDAKNMLDWIVAIVRSDHRSAL